MDHNIYTVDLEDDLQIKRKLTTITNNEWYGDPEFVNINGTKDSLIMYWQDKFQSNNNIGEAIDFYKNSKNNITNVYHHVGIYSFNLSCLKKFVNLEPSKNELNLNLEQLRALDLSLIHI